MGNEFLVKVCRHSKISEEKFMLANQNILVVVTGGIAAYKIPNVVRQLIKKGASVRVAMTKTAEKFITAETFRVLTKEPVLTDDNYQISPVAHINLADWSDLVVVTPATANTIAKLDEGIADNEALSTLLATTAPVVVFPAMNHNMWQNKRTQRHIKNLKDDGVWVVEPETGFLAEGYEGKGRLPDIDQQVKAIELVTEAIAQFPPLSSSGLKGFSFLISAGGTHEAIDPVRFLTNKSSGKMGVALSNAARLLGATVKLIATPEAAVLPKLPEVKTTVIESAIQLNDAIQNEYKNYDVVIMAAAVSDYRVAHYSNQKIKKQHQEKSGFQLDLMTNPDILASIDNRQCYKVGFAAESIDIIKYAKDKLNKKSADMIVANDISKKESGFNSDDNEVIIITENGEHFIDRNKKEAIAISVLKVIMEEYHKKAK